MSLTRAERDQFTATTPDDIAYGEGACLETPRAVFEKLHERFQFTVDLTANKYNYLLPYWFGPGAEHAVRQDALTAYWTELCQPPAVGFSNPPYGIFVPRILTKAIEEREKGFTSVFLLPMRASKWFRDLVLPHYSELWFCKSRLTFPYQGKPRLNPRTGKADGALFDSIVVVFKPLEKGQQGLFLPERRPNVWNPRTGELRY